MVENTLRILLTELGSVRIRCLGCQGVAEVPTNDLVAHFRRDCCPFCSKPFSDPPKLAMQALGDLQSAYLAAQELAENLSVEFSVKLSN